MAYHGTEPLVITLPLSQYHLNNVEGDDKHQTIIIININKKLSFTINANNVFLKYNGTSMVQTSLGTWKFVLDMGSSSN